MQWGNEIRQERLSDDSVGVPESSFASPELPQAFHWNDPMHFLLVLSILVPNRSTHHEF